MNIVSQDIKKFLAAFEKASNSLDATVLSTMYSDAFLFGDPNGVHMIKKDDFLALLPQRKGFFMMVGLQSSEILSIEESNIMDNYSSVTVHWVMNYTKHSKNPINDQNTSTYILHRKDNMLQIVFQLDHQDLMKKVQDLGLLPAKKQ